MLPGVGGVTLAVAADESVAVGHRGAVGGEPADGADVGGALAQAQYGHHGVDGEGVDVLVVPGVALEGGAGAVDVRVGEFAAAECEGSGAQIGVCGADRLHDAGNHGVEVLLLEAVGRQVVGKVMAASAWSRVGAGRAERDVLLGVDGAVRGGQLIQHRSEDREREDALVGVAPRDPVAARTVDDDGSRRAQPLVDPAGLLIEHRVLRVNGNSTIPAFVWVRHTPGKGPARPLSAAASRACRPAIHRAPAARRRGGWCRGAPRWDRCGQAARGRDLPPPAAACCRT